MTIAWNGKDLIVRFEENPLNGAENQYQVDYVCLDRTITHYVDQSKFQKVNDTNGMRDYFDVLTFEENRSGGLTRSPTVRLRTQNANGTWSSWYEIATQNTAPVFSLAPSVVSTLDGIIVNVVQPSHTDLEGYIAWVGDTPDFPLDAAHERYRGKATQFVIPLADYNTYYLRVAPYDSFSVETSSAWSAIEVSRAYNDISAVNQVVANINSSLQSNIEDALRGIVANDLNNFNDNTTAQARITGLASDVGAANTQITSINTTLAGLNDTITEVVSTSITSLQAQIDDNASAIVTEQTVRAGAIGTLTTVTTNLTSRFNSFNGGGTIESQFTGLSATVATNASTMATNYSTLTSRFNNFNSSGNTIESTISTINTTVASNNSTQTSNYNSLVSRFNNFNGASGVTVESAISTMNSTIASNNTAQTTATNAITSRLNGFNGTGSTIESTITSINTTIATNASTAATNYSTLTSRFNNFNSSGNTIEATITNINSTIATNASTAATNLTAVQTTLNGNIASVSASLSSTQSVVTGITNQYTVKLDSGNNRIVGFGLIGSSSAASAFVIDVDQFQIVKPGGGARTTFANGAWKVYDAGGALRVQLGDLSV